jgi:hypothetical protein
MDVNISKKAIRKHVVGHEVLLYTWSKKKEIPKDADTNKHITI